MPLKLEDVRERYATGHQWLKLLVGGTPGAGKTLYVSTFPNVLYADAEGRLLSVRNRDVKAVRITSTSALDELRAALAQGPAVREKVLGAPVDTVVLDTVDEIAKLFMQERLKQEKREIFAMGDWGWFGDNLRAMLRGFRNLPLHVIFNVHLKEEKDNETGRVWFKPDIQGSVGNEIAAYVDESFVLTSRMMTDPDTGTRGLHRILQTYPDLQHSWLKDHSGTLPLELPVDFKTDYQRLAKLIFGDDVPASPTPPPSVAPAKKAAAKRQSPPPAPPGTPAVGSTSSPAAVSAPVKPDTNGNGATAAETTTEVVCADCSTPLDDPQWIQFSTERWQVPLCRPCFGGRKAAKSAKGSTS